MAIVICPSCGKPVTVQEKKTGLWWGVGCLIAAVALPIIVASVGLVAAIAIPSFVRARETSQMNACINNLRILEAAKEQAALNDGIPAGAPIPESRLDSFLRGGFAAMHCPAGGTYSVNPAGKEPQCSVHGSVSNPLRRNRPYHPAAHSPSPR